MNTKPQGFTLIEVMLAGSIMGFIMIVMVGFLQQALAINVKTQAINSVFIQGQHIKRILDESIENSRSVSVPADGLSGSNLTLEFDTGTRTPTVIELSGSALQRTVDSGVSENLHNNLVQVDLFTVFHETATSSQSLVSYEFTLSYATNSGRLEHTYEATFQGSTNIRNYEN